MSIKKELERINEQPAEDIAAAAGVYAKTNPPRSLNIALAISGGLTTNIAKAIEEMEIGGGESSAITIALKKTTPISRGKIDQTSQHQGGKTYRCLISDCNFGELVLDANKNWIVFGKSSNGYWTQSPSHLDIDDYNNTSYQDFQPSVNVWTNVMRFYDSNYDNVTHIDLLKDGLFLHDYSGAADESAAITKFDNKIEALGDSIEIIIYEFDPLKL